MQFAFAGANYLIGHPQMVQAKLLGRLGEGLEGADIILQFPNG